MDTESSTLQSLGKATLTDLLLYAMTVLNQRGWFPGWYSYTSFAANYLDTSRLSGYPCWIADYRGYVGYSGSYELWQYSSSGTVNGIGGAVDLDYSYKNFLPQIQASNLNGYGTSGPEMERVTNMTLEVFGTNTEYFYSYNFNDVVGYLPVGVYSVETMSKSPYNGYTWVTFLYNGGSYWTAVISDRNRIVQVQPTCAEIQAMLDEANQKIANAQKALS